MNVVQSVYLIVSIHVCSWQMQNSNKIEMQSDYTFLWPPYLLGEG